MNNKLFINDSNLSNNNKLLINYNKFYINSKFQDNYLNDSNIRITNTNEIKILYISSSNNFLDFDIISRYN